MADARNPLANMPTVFEVQQQDKANPAAALGGIVDFNTSDAEIMKAASKANAETATTMDQAARANTSTLNSLREIQNETGDVINNAYSNLQRIGRFNDIDPGISAILSIFDSDWSQRKQSAIIDQANARLNDATTRASTVMKINSDAVDMSRERARSVEQTWRMKMDMQSKYFESQRLRLALAKEERDVLDQQIAAIDPDKLPALIEQAKSGKGPFTNYIGLLQKRNEDWNKLRVTNDKLRLEYSDQARKSHDEAAIRFLSNMPPEVLAHNLNEMDKKGMTEFKTKDGVVFDRLQLQQAIAASAKNEEEAVSAINQSDIEANNVPGSMQEVAKANAGLAAFDPTLNINPELDRFNRRMKDDQSSLAFSQNLIAARDAAKKQLDANLERLQSRYETKEAKEGVKNAAMNGGFFTSSLQAAPVLIEELASPGVAEGAFFSETLLDMQSGFNNLLKRKYDINDEASKYGTGDNINLMDFIKTPGRATKLTDLGAAYFSDANNRERAKTQISGKSAAAIVSSAINYLASDQRVGPNGAYTVQNDTFWTETRDKFKDFRADPGNPFSPIDTDRLIRTLFTEDLKNKGQKDYVNQFLGAVEAVAPHFEQEFFARNDITGVDRAVIGLLYGQNFGKAVSVGLTRRLAEQAAALKSQMETRIQDDLSPAGDMSYISQVTHSPGGYPDIGILTVPGTVTLDSVFGKMTPDQRRSSTGADLTVQQIRELYGN